MIYQSNEEIADCIRDMYLDFMGRAMFGEFSVSLTVNKGMAVKFVKSERENIVRYKTESIKIRKQEGK